MSVADAQERISSKEFTYWIAYFKREPFGHEIDHMYQAQIAATTANTVARKGKGYTVEDMMIRAEPKQPTPQEKKASFMAFMQLHNAHVKAKQNG